MIKLLLLEDYILIAYHVLEYPRRTPLPLRIPPPTLQQPNLVPSSLSQQFEPRIQLDQYVCPPGYAYTSNALLRQKHPKERQRLQ